jgi:tetratricopeptide (TPR) repeat protein
MEKEELRLFQRDYILRMIEQLSHVMARLLMLKSMEEKQEALYQLEEFYGKLMMPPVRLLLRMPDKELLALISVNGEPDLDKAVGLGIVLKEEGRVYESMEQYEESSERFNKSLFLLLTASRLEADIDGVDCRAVIDELRELLRTYRIPASTLRMLVQHYEEQENYASAEDALFELLETEQAVSGEDMVAGADFYERILELSDESLETGGLPRHEVDQGIRDLKRFQPANQLHPPASGSSSGEEEAEKI